MRGWIGTRIDLWLLGLFPTLGHLGGRVVIDPEKVHRLSYGFHVPLEDEALESFGETAPIHIGTDHVLGIPTAEDRIEEPPVPETIEVLGRSDVIGPIRSRHSRAAVECDSDLGS